METFFYREGIKNHKCTHKKPYDIISSVINKAPIKIEYYSLDNIPEKSNLCCFDELKYFPRRLGKYFS